MSRRLLLLLTLTCAVGVGTVYFPQAVSPLVVAALHASPGSATLVVTAIQIGYTAGIFLLVPLGDRLPHRPLLVTLLALTGAGLLAAGCAPGLAPLIGAAAVVGTTTVAAQVIGPLAAGLVAAERRGAVLGTLLSGSTGGMLLARTFGGTLGEWLGWRAPYLVAGAVALVLAAVLARTLPVTAAGSRERYPALLAAPLRLLLTEPELRRSCLYQATVFGGFSAVWTCLALLLTGPVYGLGAHAVGMLALVGAVTMLCTPYAGRLVDRTGADRVNLVCLLGFLVSAAVLAVGSRGGAAGLLALAGGTLLLDVAMQCGMVANQARVYALRPDARSRLNTAYMTCAYLGGSGGSWLGVRIHGRAGWPGVCALVAVLAAVALARHLVALRGRGPDARQAGDGGRGGPVHVGIGRPPAVPRLSKQPVERRAL
ncbi:MFS transporter [Streptomyces sp. NRRL S-241]|uniref:MFS transporter n=1 Tax=Streptomyces sp. NRRL S-241 TaxID=1463896 RepID=UPI000997F052|nr:MFS transporter [Streptomyces sp. NRRL S-241]